ncbi:hypothetical protein L195_g062133, partial [Trifolium pratense]
MADNANGSEKIEDDDVEVEESSDPSFDDSVHCSACFSCWGQQEG